MGLFSISRSRIRHGIVIDVGSGSVLVSIVRSDPTKDHPTIVWSRREHVPVKEGTKVTESANHVLGAFLNAMLYIDSEGRKVLRKIDQRAILSEVQVTVAAPWAYTITKTISYSDKNEFVITQDMIEELVDAAQKKTLEELKENEIVSSLGLTIMTRSTVNMLANGYPTEQPYNQQTKSLSLAHISAVAQESLVRSMIETRQKVAPGALQKNFSFMLIYYSVIRNLYNTFTDYCLVDVTNEATEMGIVRDGSLQYCTHTPIGTVTIARDVAARSGVPIKEVFAYIRNPEIRTRAEERSPKLKAALSEVTEEYRTALRELFSETGDTLSVPKIMFLHADLHTEPFFKKEIAAASLKATKVEHAVYVVTNDLLVKRYSKEAQAEITEANGDTALLLSAQFFHNQHLGEGFEHEI